MAKPAREIPKIGKFKYAAKIKPTISMLKYFLVGITCNRIAIPTTGRILPAIDKPLVNHSGTLFKITFTILSPKMTQRAVGIAVDKPKITSQSKKFDSS